MKFFRSLKFSGANWSRFRSAVSAFRSSEVGKKATLLFVLLVGFMISINSLNVLNSFVGRDFMTAIERRDGAGFFRQLVLYIGVFALSTVAAVIYRFVEERLALLWRDWQTRRYLDSYLHDHTYVRLQDSGNLQNPDQRIADDIRSFTTTTLSFILMSANGIFTAIAFSGVLWSIHAGLFCVAVAYAVGGTILTIWLGKPLVGLNYQQLDKEANFRSELIHVRDHAESIAIQQREGRVTSRLIQRLEDLVANSRRIISVNRNLGFFTNGYNYMIQLIPAIIVAPMFIGGKVEFGVITQSAMAFATLMGAFSLIVTQFQSISSYAAVVARLGALSEALEAASCQPGEKLEVAEDPTRVAFEHVTLLSPSGTEYVKDLNVSVPQGVQVLIAGASGHAKVALFKAAAGLCCRGEGRVIRPARKDMLFVPERPHLPRSSLRELLTPDAATTPIPDEDLSAALAKMQLREVEKDSGGLDTPQDWADTLGSSEQSLLTLCRVLLTRPAFAFLDRLSATLDFRQTAEVLQVLREAGVTCLVLGKPDENLSQFDAILYLSPSGRWHWRRLSSGSTSENPFEMGDC